MSPGQCFGLVEKKSRRCKMPRVSYGGYSGVAAKHWPSPPNQMFHFFRMFTS